MARHSNNLDGLSRYEVLLVFNSLVLNCELSTLLREKGLYYVDSRIEDYADGSSAFFLIFKKEGEEGSCQVQFKDTVVAGSLNDKQIIRSLKDFFNSTKEFNTTSMLPEICQRWMICFPFGLSVVLPTMNTQRHRLHRRRK